jgi:hypothetical protein
MNEHEAGYGGDTPIPESLAIPLKAMTKLEITTNVDSWINSALEAHDPADLYVYAKQMEAVAEALIERLKGQAFNDFGEKFGGSSSGTILGHDVKLSWPERWVYPADVQELAHQQKLDLDAAQMKAKAEKRAFKEQQLGRITVILRKGL